MRVPLPSSLPFPLGGGEVEETASAYARMLKALLPPGRLWKLLDSTLHQFFLACGDELARIDARAKDLLFEMQPSTTFELLPDWEADYQIPSPLPGDTTEMRQARILARRVKRQRFRPRDFQVVCAPVLGLAVDDVEVIERKRAGILQMNVGTIPPGKDREIYRFLIFRDWTAPGTYDLAEAQRLVDAMKPTHTKGVLFETKAMVCNDPHSLVNRDLIGV